MANKDYTVVELAQLSALVNEIFSKLKSSSLANNTTYTLDQDATDGHKIVFTSSDGTTKAIIIPDNNTEYGEATATTAGLLSAALFNKINGIEEGANKYELPQADIATLGGIKVGGTTAGNHLAVKLDESGNAYVEQTDTVYDDSTVKADIAKKANADDVYAKTETYSQSEVDSKINEAAAKVYTPRGTAATFEDLPADAAFGDVYNVTAAHGTTPAGTNYAWAKDSEGQGFWDALGGTVDLSPYAKTEDFTAATDEQVKAAVDTEFTKVFG